MRNIAAADCHALPRALAFRHLLGALTAAPITNNAATLSVSCPDATSRQRRQARAYELIGHKRLIMSCHGRFDWRHFTYAEVREADIERAELGAKARRPYPNESQRHAILSHAFSSALPAAIIILLKPSHITVGAMGREISDKLLSSHATH